MRKVVDARSACQKRTSREEKPMTSVALGDMTVITSFAEANEVLKSKDFIQGGHQGRLSEPFVGNTLLTLHGAAHFERRRMENALFRRDMLAIYEDSFVKPALRARLDRLRNASDLPVHAELLSLTNTVLQVIAAKVIGLDQVTDDRSVDRLRWYAGVFAEAASVEWTTDGQEQIINRGLAARDQFVQEFYLPSMRRRVDLLAKTKDGKISQDELPVDLLMMLLAHQTSEDWDEELIVRETLLYVIGSSATIAQNCAHTVWLLTEWLADHSADQSQLQDIEFLRLSAQEALRLYPASPALLRRATSEITLSTGRQLRDGEYVFIDLAAANRDRTIFGEDADDFNPHREPNDNTRLFGLSFGAGPHMCIGRPLASGGLYRHASGSEDTPSGVVPCLLHELWAAGISLDLQKTPRLRLHTLRHEFSEFPVIFNHL